MNKCKLSMIAVLSLCMTMSVIGCATAQGADTARDNNAGIRESLQQASNPNDVSSDIGSITARQSGISDLFDLFIVIASRGISIEWEVVNRAFEHLLGYEISVESNESFFVFDPADDLECGWLGGNVNDEGIINGIGYNLDSDGKMVWVEFYDEGDKYYISEGGLNMYEVNGVAELIIYAEENIYRLIWEEVEPE